MLFVALRGGYFITHATGCGGSPSYATSPDVHVIICDDAFQCVRRWSLEARAVAADKLNCVS